MDIAGQLVKQQDQRQPAVVQIGPVGQLPVGGRLCLRAKLLGQQGIRFAAFSPPERGLPCGPQDIIGFVAKPESEQRLPGLHGNSLR